MTLRQTLDVCSREYFLSLFDNQTQQETAASMWDEAEYDDPMRVTIRQIIWQEMLYGPANEE